jgi:hypothetical protein
MAIIPPALSDSARVVVLADCLEHSLEQERGNHSQRGRDHDQEEKAAQARLVGGEERTDAAQVRAAHGGIRRALRCLLGRAIEPCHPVKCRWAGIVLFKRLIE